MSNFKTLIFDFDGTIANTVDIYQEAFNNIGGQFDLPKINKTLANEIKNSDIKTFCKNHDIPLSKLLKIMNPVHHEVNRLMPKANFCLGMKKVLLLLAKNYQLGIVSSNRRENIDDFFEKEAIEIDKIFSFIHMEKNIFGKDKVLKKVIKKNNLKKTEVLYFGDQVRDIEACHKIGVKIAAVTWGFASEELLLKTKPDFILNDSDEILSIFDL